MLFSVIIPVYNRPDEIAELLDSLAVQTDMSFEVLVLEDDSPHKCEDICLSYQDRLDIKYFFRPGLSRSERRNLGMDQAKGDYYLLFDSDCIITPDYIAIVKQCLLQDYADCFGGPDSADNNFSDLQKAINYSMTSIMTTGGIRGATKKKESFSPRSFNMGISKKCYTQVGGYRNMIGEDIDLSLRIKEAGFKTLLYPNAYVYHKRRVDICKFFHQVYTFGKARILLSKLHPGSLKIVHLLPMAFVLGSILREVLVLIFWNTL